VSLGDCFVSFRGSKETVFLVSLGDCSDSFRGSIRGDREGVGAMSNKHERSYRLRMGKSPAYILIAAE